MPGKAKFFFFIFLLNENKVRPLAFLKQFFDQEQVVKDNWIWMNEN